MNAEESCARPRARSERWLVVAIFFTVFSAYMLTSGRERPWGDANVQYMAAEAMVNRFEVDIPRPWPDDQPPGRDGKNYSTYPVLTSLVQVPGLLLLKVATRIAPKSKGFFEPLSSHLASAFFGALLAVLFFQFCQALGLGRNAASTMTLILSFGTTMWVYAHYSYSEILQAALFLGFLRQVMICAETLSSREARRFGIWAGLLVSAKYIYIVSVLGAGVFLLWIYRAQLKKLARPLGWLILAALPFVALNAAYNYLCWGHPLTTGYSAYFDAYWGENLMTGLWGMFLSPGKSIFLYSPPLILAAIASAKLREHRTLALAMLATLAPVLLVYARYKLNGDWAWGPRFVVFAVPALMLPLALSIQSYGSRIRKSVLATVVVAGISVQILGLAFYWDHYIRISQEARIAWLGTPNRRGAIIPVRKDGKCDSCFEDVSHLQWLPPFQPILGHYWLLRSTVFDLSWQEAQEVAPWRRHTSLDLNIKDSYARARLDWWGLLWLKDFPQFRVDGIALLLLFGLATAASGRAWRRLLRQHVE